MTKEIDHTHQTGHGTEAVLFGIVEHGDNRTAAESLNELQLLATTADYVVAGCMVQHRRHPTLTPTSGLANSPSWLKSS
ncbi:MAG: hypothetical protein WCR59_10130, partial [Planctomycetota bacterium]